MGVSTDGRVEVTFLLAVDVVTLIALLGLLHLRPLVRVRVSSLAEKSALLSVRVCVRAPASPVVSGRRMVIVRIRRGVTKEKGASTVDE